MCAGLLLMPAIIASMWVAALRHAHPSSPHANHPHSPTHVPPSPPGLRRQVCLVLLASSAMKPESLSMFLPPRQAYGAKFADPADPLLFSVRSGAAVSMPVSAVLGVLLQGLACAKGLLAFC